MVFDPDRRRERHLEAARGYLMLDMPDHALQQLAAVDEPELVAFDVHSLRGEALRQKAEHHAALNAYHKALNDSPDDLGVLFGMAWCYKRTDRLDEAIASMQRAYEAAPDEAVVLYNLSCYWALAGDKENALSWLGRALRMDTSLRKLVATESDFDSLRDDPDFQFIVQAGEVIDDPSETS